MKRFVLTLMCCYSIACFSQGIDLSTPPKYSGISDRKYIAIESVVSINDKGGVIQSAEPSTVGSVGSKGIFTNYRDCDVYITMRAYTRMARDGLLLARPDELITNPRYDLTSDRVSEKHITLGSKDNDSSRSKYIATLSCAIL